MADVIKNDYRVTFDFKLARDDDETSRALSIDGMRYSAEAVSAAKAFREEMLGGGSMFSIIDPTKFVQPANWRDTDEAEEEWTTTDVGITFTQTTTYIVDTGGGGGGERNLQVSVDGANVTITFNGDGTPIVVSTNGNFVSPTKVSEGNFTFTGDYLTTYVISVFATSNYYSAATEISIGSQPAPP